ncbi:MAG: NADH:flavin oxidoreductase/NADH oxidase [Microbacteriaceae bacterium]
MPAASTRGYRETVPATFPLFSPLTIRDVELRNRILVSPMCQYSVEEQDGIPVDWHLVNLGQFAVGGAGLVFTEATAVSPEGRITPQDTGIWNDAQRDAWQPIVAFLHARGAAAGIQLAHAGRKASTWRPWAAQVGSVPAELGGWQTLAPSPSAYEGYDSPAALETAGIDAVVEDFRAAARRSVDAGFDVIEVHAAHGYLVHEFLSPLSNQRDDDYGGGLENRARLLLRIVTAVREAAPSTPVFVRLSATDWVDGGWSPEDTAQVAGWAREAGADFFDISSGGLIASVRYATGPGYQVHLAERVRELSGVDVSAVGMITTAAQANELVASGRVNAVMIGREFLRDPHFPLRAAHELGVELDYWPEQYLRARWPHG